jgi:hypothetical protein
MVKNVYLEQVCLNGVKRSKKGESPYKTKNGKAVLQIPGEHRELIEKCLAEDGTFERSDVRRNYKDQWRDST